MRGEPNSLVNEKSPYLLKHAYNPVRWLPWGKEAFAKSRNDNKPVFLSIGYSTCHWCTVFERESFEDEKTAAFINKHFIPIKVDREERPEVDAYYMGAVQAMTGGGGWPLTVFLTPELKAFYGGTYFPPEPRYGMPSFMQVLEFVAGLWRDKKEEVRANSEQVVRALKKEQQGPTSELSKAILDETYAALISSFDDERGGFGAAPKFPLPGTLSYLLRYHYRTGKELALKAVIKTLDGMLAGGIRDHVGGGFHRYSTDRVWLVPHFEKMLYDNALIAKVCAEAHQATKDHRYATVVRETLRWMTSEMQDGEGGFYAAQDADTSEGEGTFYTWTPEEVRGALGEDAARYDRIYGVTRNGNFEGRTILHLEEEASASQEFLARSNRRLYSERLKRPRPATDTKVLTSWNGLAISALALGSVALNEGSFQEHAIRAAEFILKKNVKDGRLLRRYAGGEAALDGTLEDYAFFVQGLLDLFEASANPRWLREAIRLTEIMARDFDDKEAGGFFLTTVPEPAPIKESYDGPIPSGNSVAALNLIRLAEITGKEALREKGEKVLRFFAGDMERNPSGHTAMLAAVDLIVNGTMEVVITSPGEAGAKAMRAQTFSGYVPDKVVLTATKKTFQELSGMSTLLLGREPAKRARAFVCRNFACKLPADSVEALARQLAPPKG